MPSKTRKAKATRISPAESATQFPLETVKTGLDGQEWIVSPRGKSQRWVPHKKEVVLFVVYKPVDTEASWDYRLPKGWWSVGAGGTTNPDYPREEQLQGPADSKAATKAYLTKFFAGLKKKGIVEQFKIKGSL